MAYQTKQHPCNNAGKRFGLLFMTEAVEAGQRLRLDPGPVGARSVGAVRMPRGVQSRVCR